MYDAENHQVGYYSSGNGGAEPDAVYRYDGDGKRVKKVVPATGETTIFVYDASGRLVAEYSTIVANAADAKVAYLTNDHLGSPRINTDASGNVTARHDYHPFGEEIGALAAVPGSPQPRTAALGYTTDTIRKQFTGYERDTETNLDFAQARYYVRNIARFNSPDPMLSSGRLFVPASWNRYTYVLNNPLNLVDPSGLYEWDSTLRDDDRLDKKERERRRRLRDGFKNARINAKANADRALEEGKITQAKYDEIISALDSYGAENTPNGVTVGIGTKDGNPGSTDPLFKIYEAWNNIMPDIQVKFDEEFLLSDKADVAVVHEGAHVEDSLNFARNYTRISALGADAYLKAPENMTQFATERHAFQVQSYYFEAMGSEDKQWGTWKKSWAKLDAQKQQDARQVAIDATIFQNYKLSKDYQGWHMGINTCRPCPR